MSDDSPRLVERLGDAEVGDQRVALGREHVVRLDVPVHYAVPVGVAQRVGHVAQDAGGLGHGQLALAPEPRAQRLALHQRHGVVEQLARLAGGEQRDDVGMLERRGQVDLAAEAVEAQAGGEVGRSTLITTGRPRPVSSATNTRLMAPPPSSRPMT